MWSNQPLQSSDPFFITEHMSLLECGNRSKSSLVRHPLMQITLLLWPVLSNLHVSTLQIASNLHQRSECSLVHLAFDEHCWIRTLATAKQMPILRKGMARYMYLFGQFSNVLRVVLPLKWPSLHSACMVESPLYGWCRRGISESGWSCFTNIRHIHWEPSSNREK